MYLYLFICLLMHLADEARLRARCDVDADEPERLWHLRAETKKHIPYVCIHTHTHTHIYIYIYIYVHICGCVYIYTTGEGVNLSAFGTCVRREGVRTVTSSSSTVE